MKNYKIFVKALGEVAGDITKEGNYAVKKGKAIMHMGGKAGKETIKYGYLALENMVLPCDAQKNVYAKRMPEKSEKEIARYTEILTGFSTVVELFLSAFFIKDAPENTYIIVTDAILRFVSTAQYHHNCASLLIEAPYHIAKAGKNYFDDVWERAKQEEDEEDSMWQFRYQ